MARECRGIDAQPFLFVLAGTNVRICTPGGIAGFGNFSSSRRSMISNSR
jgi:hypothetical protein